MFNKLHNIYAPEWYKLIKPFGIIDKILQFIQVQMPILGNIVDRVISYKYKFINKQYAFISINNTNIVPIIDNALIAGMVNNNIYKYAVYNIPESFEILGCSFTDYIGIRGIDYIIRDGVYLFKEHPSKFCYTFSNGYNTVHNTVGCIGNKTHALSYYSYRYPATSDLGMMTYDSIIKTNSTLSLNHIDLHYKGIYASQGLSGTVTVIWSYGDYTFAILSTGSFVIVHKDSEIILELEKPVLLKNNMKYFTVELNNTYYPVSVDANLVSNYPDILVTYPELKVANDRFFGLDLFYLLKNYGCNFIDIPYINTYTIDNTLVKNNINQGDKSMYLGNALILKSFMFASDSKMTYESSLDTFITNIKVEVKYAY